MSLPQPLGYIREQAIKFDFRVFQLNQVSVTRVDRCDVASSHSVTPCANLASLSQNFLQFFVHVTVQKRDAEGGYDPEQRLWSISSTFYEQLLR